ncbi:hypothetical protein BDR06DRAFT_1013805 [Suillus hirtellus]|nr:hypothetical protein BDR06DRAFT_1013805 [Suillus hirtellus]
MSHTRTAASNPQAFHSTTSPSPSVRGHLHEPHNQRPLHTTTPLVFYWPDFGEALSIKEEKLPTALHLLDDYAQLDREIEGDEHSDLALEAAKAEQKVYKAKKHLANCILAHQSVILDIWCQHIQAVNSDLLMVELNVGHLHTERKKISISMSMTWGHSDGTTTVSTSSSY